jgi:hypothetical protein
MAGVVLERWSCITWAPISTRQIVFWRNSGTLETAMLSLDLLLLWGISCHTFLSSNLKDRDNCVSDSFWNPLSMGTTGIFRRFTSPLLIGDRMRPVIIVHQGCLSLLQWMVSKSLDQFSAITIKCSVHQYLRCLKPETRRVYGQTELRYLLTFWWNAEQLIMVRWMWE